jgi:hypothetical protein
MEWNYKQQENYRIVSIQYTDTRKSVVSINEKKQVKWSRICFKQSLLERSSIAFRIDRKVQNYVLSLSLHESEVYEFWAKAGEVMIEYPSIFFLFVYTHNKTQESFGKSWT